MRCFRSGHNWSVSNQREVNSRIGHEIGLKLIKIDIKGTIEPERSGDRRDNLIMISAKPLNYIYGSHTLGDQAVQVFIVGPLDS